MRKVHLASEDCTGCHRSHDSNYPSLLTRPPVEMCLDGCHKEIKETKESSEFKHEAMTKGLAASTATERTTTGSPLAAQAGHRSVSLMP